MNAKQNSQVGVALPVLYVVEIGVAEEDIEYYDRWYAGRHAPDLYDAGFHRCTSYRTVEGSFNVLDLYEIPSWEILTSESYKRVGRNDPYRDAVLRNLLSQGYSLYDQTHMSPTPETSAARRGYRLTASPSAAPSRGATRNTDA